MAKYKMAPAAELDDRDWALLDTAVRRIEESWRGGNEAELAEMLPPVEHSLRLRVLVELVKADQECRYQAGRGKRLEEYLADWPELKEDPEAKAELLAAECLTRGILDSLPTAEELRSRFPEICEQVDLKAAAAEAGREKIGRKDAATPMAVSDMLSETPHAGQPQQHDHVTLRQGDRFGRYEIRAVLGYGGMGTVYRAFDTNPNLPRQVALKIPRFDPDAEPTVRERFVREAQAVAKVQHVNTCQIYDAGQIDGAYYIAMELIEGEPLSALIKGHTIDPRYAAETTGKLARALDAVHARDIIHRDIKPSNVMIDSSGEPRLMDFGLARPVQSNSNLTTTGSFLGTLPYMSPEQVDGEPADVRNDVYSLGVLLYQMLTGELPFGGTALEVVKAIAESKPAKPSSLRPELDAELEAICLKAMAGRPADRYQSAGEMADALKGYLAGSPVAAVPPRRRWGWIATAAAAVATTAALLAAVLVYRLAVPPGGQPAQEALTAKTTVAWTTYLGGSEKERAYAITTDPQGNCLIAGFTESDDFPTSAGFDSRYCSLGDAFVAKVSPTGQLVWASYLGGNKRDLAWGIAADAEGNVLVAGVTDSDDFPTWGECDPGRGGGRDAFIAKLSPAGKLIWARFLGGGGADDAFGIHVDTRGNILVTGNTDSAADFPVSAELDCPYGGGLHDAFIAKLAPSGELLWARLLGGKADETGLGITADAAGNVLLTGATFSTELPAADPLAVRDAGAKDAFVAKMTSSGELVWIVFLGGSAEDSGLAIAVDRNGNAVVAGETRSADFPTQDARGIEHRGARCDGFVAKITPSGKLVWTELFAASREDVGYAIAVDAAGNTVVAGDTDSPDFPHQAAFDTTLNGKTDAFLVMVDPLGQVQWASYLGAGSIDRARAVAVDPAGDILVTGFTESPDFATGNVFDTSYNYGVDVFVTKIIVRQ